MSKEELISYLNNIDFENSNIVYNEIEKLAKEYQQENKILKEKYENAVADYETTMTEKNKLETQQKEFINYLENMLDDENDIFSVVRVKDVLQKYREITGVSNEKK